MNKSKGIALYLSVVLVFVFFAASSAFAKTKVIVFAAASMTESLGRIAELYEKTAPDIEIIYNFDSSGTLKTQIEHGADCDVFISAGQRQMNDIEDKFIMPGTRFDILQNSVVMIVPKGRNPKGISEFGDAVTDKVSMIALGNSDVPVGQYSEEIFTNLGLWDELKKQNKTTYGSNVKEVLSQVAAAAVDCGVVYGTDAAGNPDVEIVAKAPGGSHKPIAYPAAILKKTSNEAASRVFVDFLKGPEASGVFTSIGFTVPK